MVLNLIVPQLKKKNEVDNINPKNINDLMKQKIKPYIDSNIQKSIELNKRNFNINNEKLNYLKPLSYKSNSECNSKFTLKDNKSTEKNFNYNFNTNRNTNIISNINSSIIDNNYHTNSFSNNNKNKDCNNVYNNKNSCIIREDPSQPFLYNNDSNDVGKKLFYI